MSTSWNSCSALLCSAPDLDLETAFAIERNVRAGKLGAGSNEIVALHIRAVFWKLLLVREMLDDEGVDEGESRPAVTRSRAAVVLSLVP